jgi:hypothetical protein
LVVVLGGRFAYHYFVVYPADHEVQARYQAEFRPAMDYVRERRGLFDHVFISDTRSMSKQWHTSEAYIYPLVYLPIEPADFQAMPKVEVNPTGEAGFHDIRRAGDFTFDLSPEALAEFAAAWPAGRILVMARPGEVTGGRLVGEIARPPEEPGATPRPCLQLLAFDLSGEQPRLTASPRP